MMPAIAVILLWVGRALAAHFILRILVGAGLSLVAYKIAVEPAVAAVRSLVMGMPLVALDWIGYMFVDKALTVITSAYLIRASLRSMSLVKS